MRKSNPRSGQIVLTFTIPKGMTLAQAAHAYWNGGFDGDTGPMYRGRKVDVDAYFSDGRSRRPMVVRLGRASMVKPHAR
jgi:hypothetical protein